MSKVEWYRNAVGALGLRSLVRLQLKKRFSHSGVCMLTAKKLQFGVLARGGTSDFTVFNQIFVEDEYGPLDRLKDVSFVIDCGANVGYSSAYFLSRHPHSFLIAVEPDEANFDILTKNLRPYGERALAVRAAVWPNHARLRFKDRQKDHGEWSYSVEQTDQETGVTPVTIPDLIAMSSFGRVSILKVDIEGAELNLFQSAAEWLNLIDNIVIELHGKECSDTFFRAISKRPFEISRSGEVTVCLAS